jgi:hypothetical protein
MARRVVRTVASLQALFQSSHAPQSRAHAAQTAITANKQGGAISALAKGWPFS